MTTGPTLTPQDGIRFASVCSGIEAASIAWEPLGWRAEWLAEVEPFPSAVLAHHWPDVPNLGDMSKIATQVASGVVSAPDILVGGTPCQAFSVAGARLGLADERGQLVIKFVELADAMDRKRSANGKPPIVVVWENVPGILSSKDNAFGAFTGLLAGEDCELQPPGRKWADAGYVRGPQRTIAWRVLDAQYFGLAQRRRRVFVVASASDGFDPGAVLFESDGLRRDTPPSRETGQGFTHDVAPCLTSSGRGVERVGDTRGQDPVVAIASVHPCLQANGKAAGSCTQQDAENGALVVHGSQDPISQYELALPLGRNHGLENVLAFGQNNQSGPVSVSHALNAHGGPMGRLDFESETFLVSALRVRRLTPVECERLQGFPDGHTAVTYRGKPASDGPRYKALGNSMAVPVMRWLGTRISMHYHHRGQHK